MLRLVCRACVPVMGCALIAVALAGCGSKNDATNTGGGTKSAVKPKDDAATEAAIEERNYFPLALADDFKVVPADKSLTDAGWTSSGDIITCTGTPKGYIYTKELYDNFTLRFDVQFKPTSNPDDEKKLNTGVLVYIDGEPKVWPKSLEVQGKYAELGTIKSNGGAPDPEITDHADARQTARKPPGDWNSVEIVSKGGALSVKVNGTLVCESKPGELKQGAIGFQAEGVEVKFRKIRVFVLDPDAS